MARCAVIKNDTGLVVNVIMAEETDLAPDGCYLKNVDDIPQAQIGSTWNGTEFVINGN